MRCPRCGNENSTTNRFCGMCGATLLQGSTISDAVPLPKPPQVAPPPAPPAPAVTQAPAATSDVAPRTAAPINDASPVISGPSFLGLNEPAPAKRGRGSLSIDPGSSSRSVDYLLEDDEEPKSGGAGKWILILAALALAGGFGYLHWKDQGFAWLNASKKPAATLPSDSDDTAAAPPPANAPAPSPVGSPSAGGTQPSPQQSAPATGQPASPATTSTPIPASSSTTTPVASGTSASAPATSNTPVPLPTNTAASSTSGEANNANSAAKPLPRGTGSSGTTTKDAGDASDDSSDADNAKPTAAAASKPTPAPIVKPSPRIDTVAEAQKYLYGKGAQQNCDRGLRLLKPAADQSNTKAMIEMGALYSAGLCTPRDLPTAYRWFALALRKDPDNESVQADLQKLWGEMTQPERQLAIRLSQ